MPNAFALRSYRNRLGTRSRVRSIVRDCAIALALFGLLLASVGWTAAPSQPMTPADVLSAGANPSQFMTAADFVPAIKAALPLPQLDSGRLLQQTDRVVMVAILASVFAAIIAFNLWFLRHLGRVYASTRPGGGRRG